MNITLQQIADLVAIKRGEYADRKLRRDSPATGLLGEDMIEPVLEMLAIRLTMEAGLEEFRGGVDFRTAVYNEADFGDENMGVFEMPDDYLRLVAFRMSWWPRTLTEDDRGDRQRLSLGAGAPGWLLMRGRRPMIEIDTMSEGLSVLRFSMSGDKSVGRLPAVARYIPRPRYDRDECVLYNIDPGLLPRLVEELSRDG